MESKEMTETETIMKTERSFLQVHDFTRHANLTNECVEYVKDKLRIKPSLGIIYGRECFQQRDIGFFSDVSRGYRYSGQIMPSQPLGIVLTALLDAINQTFDANFNSILVNMYKDGNNYIGPHSDDEAELDKRHGVIALSVGVARKFRIRTKSDKKFACDISTKSHYILHMGGQFQSEFTHEIPVEKKIKDWRISFTFRHHTK
jgi:alkylated DNA repair dioxygenase AlkB